jgi:hypothetical protein
MYMVHCKRCKRNVDITDTVIKELSGNRYTPSATCLLCSKPISRAPSMKQVKLLPKHIIAANEFGAFTDYKDEKTGGILPLLPLLAAIFGGLTAAGSTAGVVANSVLQAKRNQVEQRHNLEVEKMARGEGLSEYEGGVIPVMPLIAAITTAAKAYGKVKHGEGINQRSRTLDEIVDNIDSVSDDEKRKLISAFHGLGFVCT